MAVFLELRCRCGAKTSVVANTRMEVNRLGSLSGWDTSGEVCPGCIDRAGNGPRVQVSETLQKLFGVDQFGMRSASLASVNGGVV